MSNNEPRDASHYRNGFNNPAGRISELEHLLEFAQKEIDGLRARVAELEFESLQVVANKGCGELPQGWVINMCMENGAAWVEVINPSGYTIDIDRAGLSLTEQVSEALSLADEIERAGGEK